MASIAVRLSAQTGQLVNDFGMAEQRAEGFKNRLQQIGNITGKAFAPVATGLRAVATGTGNVLTSLGRLSSIASSSAAILSKFSQGNEELKKRFESLTITLAILAPALSALGPAVAFLTGPIGLVVAAIGGAILVFRNWETVSRVVTQTAAQVWAKLGEFFVNLWGGLGTAAQGLGQILLGAFTLDIAKVQEGYQQMIAGFTGVKDTMVTAASGIAAGIGTVITRLRDMAASLVKTADTASEATQRMMQNIQLQLDAEEAAAQRSAELREIQRSIDQEQAETRRVMTEERIAQIQTVLTAEEEAAVRRGEIREVERQIEAEQQAARASAAEQMLQNTSQFLGALSTIFGKNKVFAIAQAIIATHQGVTQALRDVPFPANLAAAAVVLAKGIASVITIQGTKMAHGGIVTRPMTPLIGEAGPEAVIPLRGSRGRAALAELGGGGDLIAHFHFDGHELAKIVVPLIPGIVRVQAGIRTA